MATATSTTSTRAKSSKAAPKATTKQAAATAATAKGASAQAQRTLRAVVADGVYAAVGATDSAVEVLRTLPAKVSDLRAEVPGVEELPKELQARLEVMRTDAGKELDALVDRGRTVVGTISRSAVTTRALEQTRVARTQVKAAVTSVRRAVDTSADAAGSVAGKVGRNR